MGGELYPTLSGRIFDLKPPLGFQKFKVHSARLRAGAGMNFYNVRLGPRSRHDGPENFPNIIFPRLWNGA